MNSFSFSQTPEQTVQAQLEAYNSKNIGAFMNLFDDEVEIYTLGEIAPSVKGWENVKSLYQELFILSPNLNSTIVSRTVIGNKVIDHEKIIGRRGSDSEIYLVMIYEVENGKIRRAWAIRE